MEGVVVVAPCIENKAQLYSYALDRSERKRNRLTSAAAYREKG
jgi:hypothetical protein